MRLRILTYCLIQYAIISVFGQVDSLKLELEKTEDPKVLASLYNQLAWKYRDLGADSALLYAERAHQIAKENGLHHDQIQSLNYQGVAYRNLSVYSKAFEKYLEALKLSEEHDDKEQRGYALINLGNLYLFQKNFQGAINYFMQGLDQALALGNRRMQAYCYVNLGRSYRGKEEFEQSELYYKQAIKVREELKDVYGIKAAEVDLADTYRRKGEFDEALRFSAYLINKLNPEKDGRGLLMVYNNIAKVRLAQKELKLAEESALEALAIAEKFSSRYDVKEIYLSLSQIYEEQQNFAKAFEYNKKYANLNQQLFSEEKIRRIEQLKNQYEIREQEAENKFLKKQDELNKEIISRQRTIIALGITGLVLLMVIAVLIYRAYVLKTKLNLKIQKQKDEIQKDKDTIEQQSNKLKELDEAKSRFFANVSHDLRSPLSLILGNLEIINEDEDSFLSPKSKKSLEVGFKNSKRLLYLTDEINDITRLEEGKIKLKLELVRVNAYLRLLTEMFKASAEYKGVKLDYNSTLKDHETLSIDPRQFEKIFYNLVSNAIRHTKSGDSIIIRVGQDSSGVLVGIQDTGEGIHRSSLPYIFDRFFQSKDNPYKSHEGLGIGLALVKELVDLHNGEITVDSEVGVGTEFKIVFPRPEFAKHSVKEELSTEFIKEQNSLFKELEIDTRSKPSIDVTKEDDRPSILIVDDHPEIRYYIRQILEDDYTILEASHGLEALDILGNKFISLIITDLMMPWMDGFELIEAINQHEDHRKIPLLVVSARVSDDAKEQVMEKGINDYLQKPFEKKELLARITNILNQKDKWENQTENVFQTMTKKENVQNVEHDILHRLEMAVKDRISDPHLSVLSLSDTLAASERQVYRLVKRVTGLTPHEYITEVRLQYADYLIRKNKVRNASEAARSIGQKNVTIFNKQYHRKFGVKPTELLQD